MDMTKKRDYNDLLSRRSSRRLAHHLMRDATDSKDAKDFLLGLVHHAMRGVLGVAHHAIHGKKKLVHQGIGGHAFCIST